MQRIKITKYKILRSGPLKDLDQALERRKKRAEQDNHALHYYKEQKRTSLGHLS